MTIAVCEAIQVKQNSLISGVLIVSGTCIGGGMLAMPIQTAETGFFISSIYLMICWIFMTLSGLFLVEATLWLKNGTHYYSLSNTLIGKRAKTVALLVYLFMNYASLVAYTVGGAHLIHSWTLQLFGVSVGAPTSSIIFVSLFSFIVYLGAKLVGRINAILMVGLVASYFALIGMSMGIIKGENLYFRPLWLQGAGVFSVILSAFSYQMVVPSICSYLNYDAKKLKKAIIFGTSIPCVVYLLWQLVIHGAVPLEGEHGLKAAFDEGAAATSPLSFYLKHWSIALLADSFAFFAVVTSFLGLSFSLFQFLEDYFKEKRKMMSRNLIIILSAIPVIILSILFPRALITCFDITGGFGDTILSGLLPIMMVWAGRYKKGYASEFNVFGGKKVLLLTGLFFICIFLWECIKIFVN